MESLSELTYQDGSVAYVVSMSQCDVVQVSCTDVVLRSTGSCHCCSLLWGAVGEQWHKVVSLLTYSLSDGGMGSSSLMCCHLDSKLVSGLKMERERNVGHAILLQHTSVGACCHQG